MNRRQLSAALSFAILSGLIACHRKEKFSTPLWFFSYSSIAPSNWDSILKRSSFLDLEPDGSFTRNFDRFEYGKWSLAGNQLYLTNQDHVTYVYRVTDNQNKKLGLVIAAKKTAFFESGPRPRDDTARNPFSLYNNRWRIRSTRPESTSELRQRLLNHLHFWETYFQWGDDNNVGALDVKDVPSPVRIHGNGFGLIRYAHLSSKWKSCFYGEADCHAADSLIRDVFRRTDIKWPATGDDNDDGKEFISGMQQLETALRSK